MTEMVEIERLGEETLWDIAGFCYRHPEREENYVEGDVERFQEGRRMRADYLRKMLLQGARAQIAYQDGKPAGFIEYYPIQVTNLELDGRDIMAVWCINVREEARGRGIGSRLIEACLDDARQLGRKGVAVTCWDPFWMPRAIFERHGFADAGAAGRNGRILLKAFRPVAAPCWIEREPAFRPVQGKLVVDLYYTVRCPIHWRNAQLVKEIAAEFEPLVEIREYSTDERAAMWRYGTACRTTLNGRLIAAGPLVEPQRIRREFREALDKMTSGRVEVEQAHQGGSGFSEEGK
ncbi:MAG: GNAT family N-acetyltransferase [Anaerolineae bacterium]